MCDHLNKEKQSRDADTNNKEERLKTNKPSCGSIHSVHESLVDVLVSFHMLRVIPHVVELVALCAQILIHLLSKYQLYSVREFLVEIYTAKNGRVRCCLYKIKRSRPSGGIDRVDPIVGARRHPVD